MNDKEIDLKSECNTFVTNLCHTHSIILTRAKEQFLKKSYYINKVKGNYFVHSDFHSMTKSNYRQMVHRLGSVIVQDFRSNPAFYRLRGIDVNPNVTMRSRGVSEIQEVDPEFQELLESCKDQPVMMHDIRIKTKTEGLYERLLETKTIPNQQNKAFTLHSFIDKRLSTKINVYRNGTIQIMIGCARLPLAYSVNGFNVLIFHLGRVFEELSYRIGKDFVYPPIGDWIIDYFHLNKDGVTIDANRFNYTISQHSNHSVFYIKKFQNGEVKPRYEEQRTPHKTISELMQGVIV